MNGPMKIKQFHELELSNDGRTVLVAVERADEADVTKWAIPYKHAIWLARAILSVAHRAVERQVAGGEIEPSTIPGDMLLVESVEVLVKPKEKRAMLAAMGKWISNDAPGTTALLVDSSTAQVLTDQLREFVQMAQTLSRPS